MIYLDTSALIPLFVHEAMSDAVRRKMSTLPPDRLAISEWTKTEFVSAIGIRVRMRHLDSEVAWEIVQALDRTADESFSVLAPEAGDSVDAARYCEQFKLGLRAGDALHLAIASNHGAEMVYSLDQRMVACAQSLKIKAQVLV
ncbi:MAG TPA: type II toxin-antitoxin system VapC family toxin [Terriglobia bacterium]|nr:type II toxin-antitoxin system VapC family toxin [Terriglobia bacterium]